MGSHVSLVSSGRWEDLLGEIPEGTFPAAVEPLPESVTLLPVVDVIALKLQSLSATETSSSENEAVARWAI
jgi:hypothetical protein